jgi:hypothetical protein
MKSNALKIIREFARLSNQDFNRVLREWKPMSKGDRFITLRAMSRFIKRNTRKEGE